MIDTRSTLPEQTSTVFMATFWNVRRRAVQQSTPVSGDMQEFGSTVKHIKLSEKEGARTYGLLLGELQLGGLQLPAGNLVYAHAGDKADNRDAKAKQTIASDLDINQ